MDSSNTGLLKLNVEDSAKTILDSQQLIKKLFSVINECSICKNKLRASGVHQAIIQAKGVSS